LLLALQREEGWKRALNALSQLKPASTAAVAKKEEEMRLAWLLEFHFQG
jgi:hypothetical protein